MDLIKLGIYAAIAAAVAGIGYKAWDGFKESIARPYVQAQIAADQKVVKEAKARSDELETRASNAQRDTTACTASLATQSAGIALLQGQATANLAAAKSARAAAAAANLDKASEIAAQQRIARAAQGEVKSCQQQLDSVAKTLREGARSRLPGAK